MISVSLEDSVQLESSIHSLQKNKNGFAAFFSCKMVSLSIKIESIFTKANWQEGCFFNC